MQHQRPTAFLFSLGLFMICACSKGNVERKSMLAIGSAAHQWQVFYGDAVCPSIRQLIDGKYLDSNARKVDPWEQPYAVTCGETEITVTSFGPDRKRGTTDDIITSTPRKK
jgi:hypothetical protein